MVKTYLQKLDEEIDDRKDDAYLRGIGRSLRGVENYDPDEARDYHGRWTNGGVKDYATAVADAEEHEYDVNGMHISASNAAMEEAERVLGHQVEPEDLAVMACGSPGAEVCISKDVDHGLYMTVEHHKYGCQRELKLEGGKVTIDNLALEIDERAARKGLGIKLFNEQVKMARRHGVEQLKTFAIGEGAGGVNGQLPGGHGSIEGESNGYYTWAAFGYNGRIPGSAARQFHARNMNELMMQPGGREYWKDHGTPFEGVFDLDPKSTASRVLKEYNRIVKQKAKATNNAEGGFPFDEEAMDQAWAIVAKRMKRRTDNAGHDVSGEARVPAGSPEGGRWTAGGPGTAANAVAAHEMARIMRQNPRRLSPTAMARWMGSQGWTTVEARNVFDQMGIQIATPTLRAELSAGARGIRGAPARLNAHETETMHSARPPKTASVRRSIQRRRERKGRERTRARMRDTDAARSLGARPAPAPAMRSPAEAPHTPQSSVDLINRTTTARELRKGLPHAMHAYRAARSAGHGDSSAMGYARAAMSRVERDVYDQRWRNEGRGQPPEIRPLPPPPPPPPSRAESKMREHQVRGVRVRVSNAALQRASQLFGKDIKPYHFARWVGAVKGATVHVNSIYGQGDNTAMSVSVHHPKYNSDRTIHKKYISNNSWFMDPSAQRQGLGLKVFTKQVVAAQKTGMTHLYVHGVGRGGRGRGVLPGGHGSAGRENGYYTWAAFGYDTPLDSHNIQSWDLAEIRRKFPNARTMNELMMTPGGADYWKDFGHGIDGKFDLSPNSTSVKALKYYIKRSRRRGRPTRNEASYYEEWLKNPWEMAPELDEEVMKQVWLQLGRERGIH